MTDVADVVSAGADGREEFDSPHHRHVRTHGNGDWQGNQPDAAVGEEHRVGHENAKNSAGGADGWNYRRQASKENGNRFDHKLNEPRTYPPDAEIIQQTAVPPDKFDFAAEHPEHEHVDEQVEKAAMQKNVSKGLPNARRDVVRHGFGNQCKPLEQPDGHRGRSEQAHKSLQEKDAGAHQYDEFYARGNETAPVEVVAPPTDSGPHRCSVRRRIAGVKAGLVIG